MSDQPNTALLMLEDGTLLKGSAAGIKGTATGEICFNTGMTGYQEVFTDPSYYGQILVTTNAHIGNYGTKDADTESDHVQISGLVCKNFTNEYSRPMADADIQTYFESEKIVAIYNVDTRALVRHIRSKGAMNCIISNEIDDPARLKEELDKVPSMAGLELASKVSTKEIYTLGDDQSDISIAVLDFGTKKNILGCMVERGAKLTVFPATTSASDILDREFDGYFLSNGPGDPAAMPYAIETIKELLKANKPVFGICLGHQLLAQAQDIPTYKMHHGHRGINHPVKNLVTGKCEITSQNHGFGVDPAAIESAADRVDITHINLNDDTIEGIKVKGMPVFSVQYHPEASPGPHDSRYLFDQFLDLIKSEKK